jgi:hypothetical protein
MFNPNIKYATSKGVDLPLMYVYLAGYMSGEKLRQCTEWRKRVRDHYRKWEKRWFTKFELAEYKGDMGYVEKDKYEWLAYPIAFLDPFNGKEIDSIDKKGLTSNIPPHAIIHGDFLSVQKADVIVANMDTFGADRPMIGTHWELAWAWMMKKPIVLIAPPEKKEVYQKHPFTSQASWIVESAYELTKEGVLETFYRRMAGAIYE